MTERQQQKVYLTPEARKHLRQLAADQGCELSDIVEQLIKNAVTIDQLTDHGAEDDTAARNP